jgi:predicted enzyme related to lactoylglutathione lyase
MRLVGLAITGAAAAAALFAIAAAAHADDQLKAPSFAVAPQYSTTHVYVAPEDVDKLVASVLAVFGGQASPRSVSAVTPTPSKTILQPVQTPVGTLSVFGFQTPIPYPFCSERTGYLVTDLDGAVRSAAAHGADVIVAPFDDPIGRDAIVAWPGGVHMQLYWHTKPPSQPPLRTAPENRVYVSEDRVDAFIQSFVGFSGGAVVADDHRASGIEIGKKGETYRRVRVISAFGNITVAATDGHLPYPYGRELTGYEVTSLSETLAKARDAGVSVLVAPYKIEQGYAAMVQFPGGYIAEIHSAAE